MVSEAVRISDAVSKLMERVDVHSIDFNRDPLVEALKAFSDSIEPDLD